MTNRKTRNPKKSLQNIKNETKAIAYEDAAVDDIMELMLLGAWTPAQLITISNKYSKNIENDTHGLQWARDRAITAAKILQHIQNFSEIDKKTLLDDCTNKLYSIFDKAMGRTTRNRRIKDGPNEPAPDLKSAISAINSIAKLHGLYTDAPTVNITPQFNVINKLTDDELTELRTTGKLPASVLNDWNSKKRIEIPEAEGFNPTTHPTIGLEISDPEAVRRKQLNDNVGSDENKRK